MYTLALICLADWIALITGEPLPGGEHRIVARRGGHGHRSGFPPFPISTGTNGDPGPTTAFVSSTGGAVTGTISVSGTASALYGNYSVSISGVASSTENPTYKSGDPSAPVTTASGKPLSTFKVNTTTSISGDPTSYGTVSASAVTQSNITDPGYSSGTRGPYPFPTSKFPYSAPSTGISQSATSIANATSAFPTDPTASRIYPSRGPYTLPSSLPPYSYFTSSDPSIKATISANATTGSVSSGTASSYSARLSASPSISINATSITSLTGTGPSFTVGISTSDPCTNATTLPYFPSGTGSNTATGIRDPSTITASFTALSSAGKFSYTPTVSSQPSEYYYHHRRPPHTSQVSFSL